ncbi:hypothetical protein BDV19DRAFT_358539 [Aspergillus venezuelensis]
MKLNSRLKSLRPSTTRIPDEQIEAAAAALDDAGFNRCLDPECLELLEDRDSRSFMVTFCSFVQGRVNERHPVGYAHFSKPRSGIKLGACRSGSDDEPVISLLRQSEILPWLPSIKIAPPRSDDPRLISTDDRALPLREAGDDGAGPQGPSGPWAGPHQAQLLNGRSFTESLLWLLCRDIGHYMPLFTLWGHMLCRIASGDALFPKDLRPEFRPARDALNDRGRGLDFIPESLELRQLLLKEKRLPDDLPPIDVTLSQAQDLFS